MNKQNKKDHAELIAIETARETVAERMRRKRIYTVGDKDTLKARHDYEEEGRFNLTKEG